MPDFDPEQLHADAIAALEGKLLHDLDFQPRCDFHRINRKADRPATFTFTCRRCHVVELTCSECALSWAQHLHDETVCQHCHLTAEFLQVILVEPLGGAA